MKSHAPSAVNGDDSQIMEKPSAASVRVGDRFHRLVVQGFIAGIGKTINRKAVCLCDCGASSTPTVNRLCDGRAKSCGCYARDWSRARHTTHGHYSRTYRSSTHRIWGEMIQRCSNPKNASFHNYGARGIKVCDRWRLFENFLADMGERPAGRSLDRLNNDGDYEPGNCSWRTKVEQCRNTRRTVLNETLVIKIRTLSSQGMSGRGIARSMGLNHQTVQGVIAGRHWADVGMPAAEAA